MKGPSSHCRSRILVLSLIKRVDGARSKPFLVATKMVFRQCGAQVQKRNAGGSEVLRLWGLRAATWQLQAELADACGGGGSSFQRDRLDSQWPFFLVPCTSPQNAATVTDKKQQLGCLSIFLMGPMATWTERIPTQYPHVLGYHRSCIMPILYQSVFQKYPNKKRPGIWSLRA